MREIVDVSGPRAACDAVLSHLQDLPSVVDFRLTQDSSGRLLGEVQARGCRACKILGTASPAVSGAVSNGRGTLCWTLVSSGRSGLSKLLENLRREGIGASLEEVRPISSTSGLTWRQREILSAALDLGYYEEPRRAGLPELARRFGVSRARVSAVLRAAERKALKV